MKSAVALALLWATPAAAAEVFVGVGAHGIDFVGVANCCYEHAADIQFGLRTAPLARLLTGQLRGHLIGSVNTAGGVDYAAAGASLRFGLPLTGLYIAPGFGVGVHDGSGLKFQATRDRLYLGNRILFEPEVSIGYHILGPFAAELNVTHLSHARLAGPQNPGLTALALRGVVTF